MKEKKEERTKHMAEENKKVPDIDRYRVSHGKKVDLKKYTTRRDADFEKEETKTVLFPDLIMEMRDYQEKLYAHNRYGLIVVLQAMDAAGKDGVVKHVFSLLNPSGVKVISFKQPSIEEKDHDYMWRINRSLPARGEIGVFNRSHYEDVLVTRVHDLIRSENFPAKLNGKNIWNERYEQINNWEKYLYQNGFPMVKIFLHVSKEEQKQRLVDRIINQEKHWKFSMSDIDERQYWDEYQHIYEELLEKTSTDIAPWYVVPADNKWFTRYIVATLVLHALKKINPKYPTLSKEMEEQLEKFKKLILEDESRTLISIKKELEREALPAVSDKK